MRPEPNAEQMAALQSFKEKYGRNWKTELMTAWLNGHLLRQVRNQFGPAWLGKAFINS